MTNRQEDLLIFAATIGLANFLAVAALGFLLLGRA